MTTMDERGAIWDDLRVLLEVHRGGSFLAASRALRISTSTAARRIDALELSLGRKLVVRGSTGTKLHAEALELADLAEQLELGLRAAHRDHTDETPTGVSGRVRISAGEGFVLPLTQLLAELRLCHPGMEFEVVSETRMADIAKREADIGIRKRRSFSDVVIEKAAGQMRFGLFAARSYVQARLPQARLEGEEAFASHDFVSDDEPSGAPLTAWLRQHGAKRFVFRSNSDAARLEATLQGMGIGLMADVVGCSLSGLERVTTPVEPASKSVFVVFHRELRDVPRIRLVVDAIAERLRHGLK